MKNTLLLSKTKESLSKIITCRAVTIKTVKCFLHLFSTDDTDLECHGAITVVFDQTSLKFNVYYHPLQILGTDYILKWYYYI